MDSRKVAAPPEPDEVLSATTGDIFDEQDYRALRRRYLENHVERDVALPHNFMRLRTKTRRAAIDTRTDGFKALRERIRELEKEENHVEIFGLLKRLSRYDMKKGLFPVVRKTKGNKNNQEVQEIVDLTGIDDDKPQEAIDVDAEISREVLLTTPVKTEEEEDGASIKAMSSFPDSVNKAPRKMQSPTGKPKARPIPVTPMQTSRKPALLSKSKSISLRPASVNAALRKTQSPVRKPKARPTPVTPMQTGRKPASSPKSKPTKKTVNVEFKFTSVGGDGENILQDDAVLGKFHIPLVRDNATGLFCLQPGSFPIKGFFTGGHRGVATVSQFQAQLQRDSNDRPIFYLGCSFKNSKIVPTLAATAAGPNGMVIHPSSELRTHPSISSSYSKTDLNVWAKAAGGDIVFNGENGERMKLYTVLSEQWPDSPTANIEVREPEWTKLIALVTNRVKSKKDPDMVGWSSKFVHVAVTNYKAFLRLKILKSDFASELYAPSQIVDKAWHAHMAFNARYIRDVTCYAAQIRESRGGAQMRKVRPIFLQHNPCLFSDATEKYKNTFNDLHEVLDVIDEDIWTHPDDLLSNSEGSATSSLAGSLPLPSPPCFVPKRVGGFTGCA